VVLRLPHHPHPAPRHRRSLLAHSSTPFQPREEHPRRRAQQRAPPRRHPPHHHRGPAGRLHGPADADLELISHAPEDIKNLLNEVNRLTEALKEIDWLIETVGPDDFVYKVQLVLEDNL